MAKPDRQSVPSSSVRSNLVGTGRSAEPADLRAVPPSTAALTRRLTEQVARLAAELASAKAEILALAAKAERDHLTDVLNRRGFARELERSLAYARRYGTPAALVYVDLDGFKPINDQYGHAAGDVILRQVAAVLAASVRGSDLVARLGGDEFALLLWNISPTNARAKADAIEERIERSTLAPDRPGIGASAGITMLEQADLPEDVLSRADAAMYARKAERRRRDELDRYKELRR